MITFLVFWYACTWVAVAAAFRLGGKKIELNHILISLFGWPIMFLVIICILVSGYFENIGSKQYWWSKP